MLSLPEPQPNGSLELLRRFVEVDDQSFVLYVSWLVGALAPHGPYTVLAVAGEQGSGKTTACRIARSLVDPSEAGLRRPPRDERDLFIAAHNSRVVGFDNMSGLSIWLSDALCMVLTGGGLATRQLYSDADETILSVANPIICNGISEIASRSDLRDRCVNVTCARNLESAGLVRDERTLWADFERVRPLLLGALLDAVSTALRRLDGVRLVRPPRMADFTRWVVAAEPALPWPPGEFRRCYEGAREAAAREALEGSLLAKAVIDLVKSQCGTWRGTATELLEELNARATEATRRNKTWPTRPNRLSDMLKRIATDLRSVAGVDVDSRRKGKSRQRIFRIESRCNSSSASSANPPMYNTHNGLCADDGSSAADDGSLSADDGADDGRTIDTRQSSAHKSNEISGLQTQTPMADDADGRIRPLSAVADEEWTEWTR